jgi:twinkle protein
MINQNSASEVKQRANIVEVIGERVKLRREGGEHVGLCPFHTEKTPSFKVNQADRFFKCFGCGKQGDVFDFLQFMDGKTYPEAVKEMAVRYNVELEYDRPLKEYKKPVLSKNPLSATFLKPFAEYRKIKPSTLEKFRVTEAIEWMPKAKKEIVVCCFNYFREGELVNVKYRGANKDFKLAKDAELILYNIDSIVGAEEIAIVEGEIDCLSVDQAGIHNVVSVPNGASIGLNQKLEYLDNCWPYFDGKKKIVLMTDDDEPGRKLREELARRLGYDRCWVAQYPKECKDTNEVLVKYGEAAVAECYVDAKPWPIEAILEMADLEVDVVDYYDNGFPKGVEAGIPELDDLVTYMPGQFTTETGIPGSGKSEVIDWIATRLARRHGWPFAVVSFEKPPAVHVASLIEKFAGRSFAFRRELTNRLSNLDLEEGMEFVRNHFFFVDITKIELTLDSILDKCRELVGKKGVKGVILDPWNYIEHLIPAGKSETQYISESLTKIKRFCALNGVHLFLVAHPTKIKKDHNNKYEVPTMYSISGSAHFFNKTDNGITVYRDFDTNVVTIYVQKVRFSWLGKVGFCSFAFDTETRQYKSIEGGPAADNSDDPNLY